MPERYTTLGQSTLSAGINNVQTTLSVASASSFPTAGTFRILVQTADGVTKEIMTVTGVSGSTFTVTRGQEGTSASAFSSGDQVIQVLTAAGLDAIRADLVGRGTHASRPTAADAKAGGLYRPTDQPILYRSDGSAWRSAGVIQPEFTIPSLGSFTGVNMGSNTASTSGDTIAFNCVSNGGSNNVRMQTKSAPATPYVITAAWLPGFLPYNCYLYLGWRNSGSGNLYGFTIYTWTDGVNYRIIKWNSPSSFNADALARNQMAALPVYWMRIADNGTNRIVSISGNGLDWQQLFSVARTDFFTPDQVFFGMDPASNVCDARLLSWLEA